jgi:hypothetical protein
MLARSKALARATIVLAALGAAAPAAAQRPSATSTRTTAPSTGSTRSGAATAAPARTPSAVSVPGTRAAPVPLPPPPAGTALSPRQDGRRFEMSALLGLASPRGNGGDASLALTGVAALPWRTTSSGIALSWALPVRTILLAADEVAGVESGGLALEATPGVRASIPLGRSKASFRTDAGIGVAARWTWVETEVTYVGRRTETSNDVTGVVRLGFSLDYALRPGVQLAVEPLSFGFDLDGNADWIFAAGATFRL